MPFDPTFPPHGVGLASAPWRDQFNSLKDLIDAQAALIAAQALQIADLQDQITNLSTGLDAVPAQIQAAIDTTANNVNGVADLALAISDPPEKTEVEAVRDKVNELIGGLQRV